MEHSARFLQLVESVRAHIVEVTLAEAAQLSERDGVPLHWIDVREDHEWAAGHVPGATHLGKGILERDIERRFPDVNTPLLLYCGGGYRSALSAAALQQMGYLRVYSLVGGFRAYKDSGLPTARD
jgi:rhodanese-related sulfurtransferase